MWSLFEPIHAVTYFAPQASAAFQAAGLRGFWRAYFAGRCAPLGAIGPAPIIASFFGFAPSMVTRALPDVWSRITPEAALAARAAGARDALLSVLGEIGSERLAETAELLRSAASTVELHGRVLGAANAALPWPSGSIEVLWHAATILREHRGDGHVAALLTTGLDGCESLVWRTALDDGSGREFFQPARGWTDEEWAAATDRLVARGWLIDGKATDPARRAFEDVEAVTDRLAAGPWDRLGADAAERCAALLRPIAVAASTLLRHPNPIGLPPI